VCALRAAFFFMGRRGRRLGPGCPHYGSGLSARLGHSSITITLNGYGHPFPSMEGALAEELDAAFAELQRRRTSLS
jgi:hypothetical protein